MKRRQARLAAKPARYERRDDTALLDWIQSVRGADIRPWADGFEVITHDATTLFAGGSSVRLAINAAIEARTGVRGEVSEHRRRPDLLTPQSIWLYCFLGLALVAPTGFARGVLVGIYAVLVGLDVIWRPHGLTCRNERRGSA
jgi:hypothetical protein